MEPEYGHLIGWKGEYWEKGYEGTKAIFVVAPTSATLLPDYVDGSAIETKAGDTVDITCTAKSSRPPAHVVWIRDGRFLEGG